MIMDDSTAKDLAEGAGHETATNNAWLLLVHRLHWRSWRSDVVLFFGMLLLLAGLSTLFSAKFPPGLSTGPHLLVQAQSWLAGHLDVPASLGTHDVITVGSKFYIVYPPLPSLLMVPFMVVFGVHFSDIWFTWLVGALNVVLVYHLLNLLRQRGWSPRTDRENIVLAALFGGGTIALWLALNGAVWFTIQTLAITFTLLLLISTFNHIWWLASLTLGALLLTRSTDIVGGGLLLAIVFVREYGQAVTAAQPAKLWNVLRWRPTRLPHTGAILALVIPLFACGILYLWHNQLYFHNPLSSGYDLQIKQDYPQIQYGLFSWHYVWMNVVADFLNMPAFSFQSPFDTTPTLDLLRGGNGTSIFFTTPLFLLFFLPTALQRQQRWLHIALWISAGSLIILALCYDWTGWFQVGARYLFDSYPYLWMLLALRSDRIGWRWMALATAGVLVNLALAKTFWCGTTTCFASAHHGQLRADLFYLTLLLTLVAGVATWWWLQRDPARGSASTLAALPEWNL